MIAPKALIIAFFIVLLLVEFVVEIMEAARRLGSLSFVVCHYRHVGGDEGGFRGWVPVVGRAGGARDAA